MTKHTNKDKETKKISETENQTQETQKKLVSKSLSEVKVPLSKKQKKLKYYSSKKYEVERGQRADFEFVRKIEKTSIYNDTNELFACVHQMVYNMPTFDRYTFLERLVNLCMSLIADFNTAYAFEETRIEYIDKYFETLNVLISLLRVGYKIKIVKENDYIAIFSIIERIDKAIKLYRNSSKK